MITSNLFGSITILGQTYVTDVQIFPDGKVTDGWWREHGHRLTLQDLADLTASHPEVLVVGTGVHGRMLPEAGLGDNLEGMGIDLVIAPNHEAVRHFNRLFAERRTAACFHLTC